MEKMNSWLTLFANIGIVAGLILVAIQLNQAERYADAEQVNAEFAMNLEGLDVGFSEALPEAWARARINAPDLSDVEVTLVYLYLQRRFQEQFLEKLQAERGHSSYDPKFAAMLFVNQMLGNETALRWWAGVGVGSNSPMIEFRNAINTRLTKLGPEHRTFHLRQTRRLMEGPFPPSVVGA